MVPVAASADSTQARAALWVRVFWTLALAALVLGWVQAVTGTGGRDTQALLMTAAFACSALALVGRAAGPRVERGAWLLLAAGIATFGYTAVSYVAEPTAAGDFPSPADFGAAGYVLVAAAFVLFARADLPGLPRALWLDAAIGGFALAALGTVIVQSLIAGGADADRTALGQLGYLSADLFLAGFVFVAWGLGGFRRVTLLTLGIAALTMAVTDAIYTARIFEGMPDWPPLLAAGWTTGVVATAAAAAIYEPLGGERRRRGWSSVSMPVSAALVAVAVSGRLQIGDDDIAVYLATLVLILSVARLAMSLVDNRRAEERRRREDEMRRRREDAERASQAKTEFLSRMSHEVRTPLNSILGFAQLLVDDVDGDERQSVERILRAGKHLQQLIDDILDLSAIEAGETVVTLEPVELGPVIDESVALLDPLARSTGSGVVRRDADDAPVAAVADAQRLKQVLLNLISNALKYGGAESEVVVRVERDEGEAQVCIIDSGPGIPDDYLPRLFEPFERGPARGSGIEGSGLGLALTKNLVERMGGTIGVKTGQGGTTFWFRLPAADPGTQRETPAPAGEPHAAPTAGKRTALYIEDHVSNIKLVERLLERRGDFELLTAMTGRAGLQLAAGAEPDVVLLDLDLPDMRGEDVLVELRFDPSTSDIPVIVVSADATTRRQEELLGAGASAYVVKPIQLASFMTTLDAVVGRPAAAG